MDTLPFLMQTDAEVSIFGHDWPSTWITGVHHLPHLPLNGPTSLLLNSWLPWNHPMVHGFIIFIGLSSTILGRTFHETHPATIHDVPIPFHLRLLGALDFFLNLFPIYIENFIIPIVMHFSEGFKPNQQPGDLPVIPLNHPLTPFLSLISRDHPPLQRSRWSSWEPRARVRSRPFWGGTWTRRRRQRETCWRVKHPC